MDCTETVKGSLRAGSRLGQSREMGDFSSALTDRFARTRASGEEQVGTSGGEGGGGILP